jgi:hypothetical protein
LTVNEPPARMEDPASPRLSVAEALRTLDTFTREQAAWIVAQVQRWSYEVGRDDGHAAGFADGYARCESEWNRAASEALNAFTERDIRSAEARQWLREQADAAARLSRPGDYRGGPVAHWDDDDLQVAA